MQDKYVGDVGDFGKYGLLNEIVKQSGGNIILGINWYYVTREEIGNSDGKHIAYLNAGGNNYIRYRSCFPDLYERLKAIIELSKRSIQSIETGDILPRGTIFYPSPVPYSGSTDEKRIALRKAWFEESLAQLDKADIIFLDPDNGIQPNLAEKGKSNAIKYAFADEIESYYRQGKSIVIYNHRDRRSRVCYERKFLICRSFVDHINDLKVIRFKRVSVRDYLFVIHERHRGLISKTITVLTNPPCDFLFDTYVLEHGEIHDK